MGQDGMGWDVFGRLAAGQSLCLCLVLCVTVSPVEQPPSVLVSTGLPIRDVVAGVLSDRQPSDGGGYHSTPGYYTRVFDGQPSRASVLLI